MLHPERISVACSTIPSPDNVMSVRPCTNGTHASHYDRGATRLAKGKHGFETLICLCYLVSIFVSYLTLGSTLLELDQRGLLNSKDGG